jgi:hypothetical protein
VSENARAASLWFDRAKAGVPTGSAALWGWRYNEATGEYTLEAGVPVGGGAGFVQSESDPEDYVLSPTTTGGSRALRVVRFGDDTQMFP